SPPRRTWTNDESPERSHLPNAGGSNALAGPPTSAARSTMRLHDPCQLEPELGAQARLAESRDLDGAVRRTPPQPVELEETLRERGAERAGDVSSAFAPVE